MVSTCKVANYALSIKRYCKQERKNESSEKKPFGACVPCSWRRNSNNTSNSSRHHSRFLTIFLSLRLRSLPNVRIPGTITSLHSSIPHPRPPRCQFHNHMASQHRRRRFLSHL